MTPGFALDLWPITLTRVSRRVDALRVTEVVNMRDYKSSMMAFMGFGLPSDAPVPMYALFEDAPNSPYAATLHMVADALGAELDNITYEREVATAPKAMTAPSGYYAAGTVVATRFRFIGWVAGKPFVTIEYVWRVDEAVAPDWPIGHCVWRLEIDGEPSIRSSMELATEMDAKRPTSLTVAMHSLNAVPAVVRAPPGIVNHLTLPLVAGRSATSLRGGRSNK
jgi:4-hydroxy-tetrahydrodipicolinate reductase